MRDELIPVNSRWKVDEALDAVAEQARWGDGWIKLVGDWIDRGLVRPWTDTFHIADGSELLGTKSGPVRYAAPRGLRSLVEDLAAVLPSPRRYSAQRPGPYVQRRATRICARGRLARAGSRRHQA